jgi:hypothetical protein
MESGLELSYEAKGKRLNGQHVDLDPAASSISARQSTRTPADGRGNGT